ncbi:hypothetical protein DI458_14535 [Burkholderia contaminans]|nr:hypothetical protein [Burkholderia contaminans]MBA9864753.1 hypothetical protein [Burkholderia contaminans]MBA9906921.1 hypothetical protein [Burkholderia contaminans]MBA9930806.1 hypothetical protein [Burkholderia contaminans]MCB4328266.1 hypothetical protein [Burkholderia contaminans]
MSGEKSVDASSGVGTIVSRIVKKANAVRGNPRFAPWGLAGAPALVLPAKRRIMRAVFSKEHVCESVCS